MTTEKKERTWTDEEWTTATKPLEEWCEKHADNDDMEDVIEIVELNVKRGAKKASKRLKCWNSLLLEMRDIEDSPIGGKGAMSKYPQNVQTSLKTIREKLIEERTLAFGEMTSKVMFRRKTEGEGDDKTQTWISYVDANDEATAWANGRISMLKKAFDEERWNGTLEGLDSMTESAKTETTEATEETESPNEVDSQ